MSKSIFPKFGQTHKGAGTTGKGARRDEKQQQAAFAQSLSDLAGQTQPRPDFAAQLKDDLLTRRIETSVQDIRPNFWRQAMFKRLAFAATILTVAMAAVGLYSWLRGDQNAGKLPLLPRLVSAAGGGAVIQDGLLSDAEVVLGVDLPAAPESAPVYSVTFTRPATPEAALAWAKDFGLNDPQVYHDPRDSEAIFVAGSDGRMLAFRADGGGAGVYYSDDAAMMAPGEAPTFEQARAAAIAFLSKHHLLPEHYHVEEDPDLARRSEVHVQMINIITEISGAPLAADAAIIQVTVSSAGEVTDAYTPLWAFARLQGYPIKTAQEAWEELLAGGAFRLDVEGLSPNAAHVRTFNRPAPERALGDAVTVSGWAHVLVPERSGTPLRAQMAAMDGSRYLLGDIPDAEALQSIGFNDIQVSGMLVENLGEQYWRLSVQRWEIVTNAPLMQLLVGTFRREGKTTRLMDDTGAAYPLPSAPDDLEDGTRIEVTVHGEAVPGTALDWESINTPPCSEQNATGNAESITTVEVQVEPVATPELPYALGQTVELTGMVNATLVIESDQQWYETYLQRVPDDFNNYKLIGDEATLAELAQLHRLHVRIRGQIVTATLEWGGEGPAIMVNSYTQILPDERRYRFLGTITLETLGGQSVAVFTECSSGQRYALPADPHLFPQEYFSTDENRNRQVEVRGTLPALATAGGLPQLQIEASTNGSDIDRLPCDAPRPIDPGPVIVDRTGRSGGDIARNAFTVDRAELAYYYEPSPLPPPNSIYRLPSAAIAQPVWIFSGLSGDGATRFTAYVQAARETYVAGTHE